MQLRSGISIALLVLLALPLACAHLEAGEDRTIGNVTVDFGYAPTKPVAQASTTISLGMQGPNIPVDGTLWVRISQKDTVVFAGDVAMTNGVASFSYVFAQGGTYDITVRGYGIDTTFPLVVRNILPWLWISIALVVGLTVGLLFGWKMQRM